jgi:hypothetical protein
MAITPRWRRTGIGIGTETGTGTGTAISRRWAGFDFIQQEISAVDAAQVY